MTTNTLTLHTPREHDSELYVIHPLDAAPEQKRSSEGLGPMHLTPGARFWLRSLRVYLIAMTLVLIYRTLELAHILY